jgi:ubiquinone/menaquinone biosynthesis C-methylase UbiE
MWWLKKSSSSEPLAVSITGVKLGDRVLVIGLSDPQIVAALALKAGLTGRAAAVDADAGVVARGAGAVEREGALVEASQSPWDTLPFEDASFDLALVRNVLMTLAPDARRGLLQQVYRVLRPGGRVVVVDGSAATGLRALVRGHTVDPAYAAGGGAKSVLDALPFSAVRVLAEHGGLVFTEGVKRA